MAARSTCASASQPMLRVVGSVVALHPTAGVDHLSLISGDEGTGTIRLICWS